MHDAACMTVTLRSTWRLVGMQCTLPHNQALALAPGMQEYEANIAPHKAALFAKLFQALGNNPNTSTVLEIGIGTAPNLQYYAGRVCAQCKSCKIVNASFAQGVEVIGVDPNPEMQPYAEETAELEFQQPGDSLRLLTGSAEQLPLPDASVDAAVCTLVLCSVKQPNKVIVIFCHT